jgi:hypothetical protein
MFSKLAASTLFIGHLDHLVILQSYDAVRRFRIFSAFSMTRTYLVAILEPDDHIHRKE